MESSTAQFLLRQSACVQLPISGSPKGLQKFGVTGFISCFMSCFIRLGGWKLLGFWPQKVEVQFGSLGVRVSGFRGAKQRFEVLWNQGFRVLDRQIKDLRCCGILGWPDKRFEMLCSPGGN